MLPLWADVLAIAALPVILTLVLLIWGADDPANTVVHEQEDDSKTSSKTSRPNLTLLSSPRRSPALLS